MARLNLHKLRLARLFDLTGLNAAMLRLQSALWRPHVRIVNYHHVASSQAEAFEAQLRFYARHFAPVSEDALMGLLEGRWPYDKPGLLISFDDGVRSHFEVAAPCLEKYGFIGWFFVPAAFPEVPLEHQRDFVNQHRITPRAASEEGRIAMTWDEIRQLDRRHVVGCHTMNHCRLATTLSPEELDLEIVRAKRLMEERLGREVPTFCWVGGEEASYSAAAAATIRQAGFRLGFMTNNAVVRPGCDSLQLQRTNQEAGFPLFLIRFQLCGFLDLMYLPKRRRVNRLTAARLAPGNPTP